MAFPTSVNDQITDSVTQSNTEVVGGAPAVAMGNLYQAMAQANSLMAANQVMAQQQANVTQQATATACVSALLSTSSVLKV